MRTGSLMYSQYLMLPLKYRWCQLLALITLQPFSDCRNSCVFLITLACSGFKVESRRSTSVVVTSRFGSRSISFVIAFVKYSLKHFFSIFFTDAFLVRSSGWSRWLIFLGTITWTIFKRSSSLVTLSVDWALNASQSMSAFWSFCNPSSSLTWQKYGSTTLSNRLLSHTRCSSVLDYSLNKIHWGIQQMQVTVFTVQIKWKGNIFPVIVSSKVTVMPRLSFPPFLETCFDPVSAIATFSVGTILTVFDQCLELAHLLCCNLTQLTQHHYGVVF